MERVTKTRDSSEPGDTHNTFLLLSPVIKRYPATHTNTHYYSRLEGEAIEKEKLQNLLNTSWKFYSLQMRNHSEAHRLIPTTDFRISVYERPHKCARVCVCVCEWYN